MSRLLISVRNPAEARIAFEEGADLIDLKEPDAGALGAVSLETARLVVAAVAQRRATSATVGDLPLDARILGPAIQAMSATGVDFVKMGVWPESGNLVRAFQDLAPVALRTPLIAVLFADLGVPVGAIDVVADAGFKGIMLDTANKGRGRLRDNISRQELGEFVRRARCRRLMIGLAGSLRIEDSATLADLGPDYLGFRGAACDGHDRGAELKAERVRALRTALDKTLRTTGISEGRLTTAL
jgi:uncharacterized protein (UPF0264 family)